MAGHQALMSLIPRRHFCPNKFTKVCSIFHRHTHTYGKSGTLEGSHTDTGQNAIIKLAKGSTSTSLQSIFPTLRLRRLSNRFRTSFRFALTLVPFRHLTTTVNPDGGEGTVWRTPKARYHRIPLRQSRLIVFSDFRAKSKGSWQQTGRKRGPRHHPKPTLGMGLPLWPFPSCYVVHKINITIFAFNPAVI